MGIMNWWASRKRFKAEDGNYECKLNGIIENGWLEVELGDYYSPQKIPLKVVNRPGIGTIEVVVQPPSYTGMAAILQKSGNVQMPAGSKVKIIVKPTKELQEIKLLNKTTEEKAPVFKQEGETWAAVFVPESSMTYTLSMLDKVGLVSKDIPDFRLTVKEDKKPFIRIVKPASLTELSAKSAMMLEAKIRDDFNLSSVRILYTISSGEFDASGQEPEYTVRKEM